MSLKIKIMLLAILPMLLVATLITWLGSKGAVLLSEQEIAIFEDNLLDSKRRELRHYVEMAQAAVVHVREAAGEDEDLAKQEVKRILNDMTFGEDGYFFVYDEDGVNLVHPIQPELVGQDLIDMQDYSGDYVIRNLLRIAADGGGYHQYLWHNPRRDEVESKLGYVVEIKDWGWMYGTGLYLDDISAELRQIRGEVSMNIRQNFFNVSVIVSSVTLIIVLLGLAINLHEGRLADARLRSLAHRSIQFQVDERRRFSRELHDGINQLMVTVLYRIELAQRKLGQGEMKGLEDLNVGREVLNQAIQEVRRISHDLRPSILDDLGLERGLAALLEHFSERTNIRISKEVALPETRLPEDIEITLYRLIQEALTNVEKHADASDIALKLDHQGGKVRLDLKDNGCGFDPQANRHMLGIGLRNMRERVELLGGEYRLDAGEGEGTRIRVALPLKGPQVLG
ncbi:cache domain-containing protein [Marinobacterium lutimaris]|uniref:Oxygen sensor histidine kinase NreB n=1 Tax=Marinobacterium lutimaris TaxID=568106 RepID=A0A1H5YDR5_9GAMM|nr:cache domain-containing protein [Marinobacterium lutimaris]SEG22191.1 two-component system, NarL family, sensor kinase [Marinobacterium lutimaris]